MINAKKLIRRVPSLKQKRRYIFPRVSETRAIDKGHFAVYTCDEKRFVMPLSYLKNEIFQQLLKVAEDEYGLHGGPIRLPFEATLINYVISLIERCVCKNLEKALLSSIITSETCLSVSNAQLEQNHLQVPISSF